MESGPLHTTEPGCNSGYNPNTTTFTTHMTDTHAPAVYLAGPIHDRTDNGTTWRDELKTLGEGFDWIDPLDKYVHDERELAEEWSDEKIVGEDLQLIDDSDAVLVNYEGERTFGTPMEIFYAHQTDTPVFTVWDCDLEVSPWITAHSEAVVDDVGNARHALATYFRGAAELEEPLTGDEMASSLASDVATLLTDSRDTHGDAVENQSHIAEAWTWYLTNKLKPDTELTGADVARLMELVKLSRSVIGSYDLDHDRDVCGYSAIAAACEVAEGNADPSELTQHG